MKNALVLKAVSLVAVTMLLLAALHAIQGVVDERRDRQVEAERSVAASLADAQVVVGPLLVRRCQESWTRVEGDGAQRRLVVEHDDVVQRLWPSRLAIKAATHVEPRYRGLFKVNGFSTVSTMAVDWERVAPPPNEPTRPGAALHCDGLSIGVALSDARGIRATRIVVAGRELAAVPGSGTDDDAQGFHASLAPQAADPATLHADVELTLAGTRSLEWTPIADTSQVDASSDWPHPSFVGRFLPLTRDVGAAGFTARWSVSALATTARQTLAAGGSPCPSDPSNERESADHSRCVDTFGAVFLDPVNGYVLTDRAIKYGILFIGLGFAGIASVEVARRVRVHPVQYLFVGSALAIFFLLLISLTEHIGFESAYLCAAFASSALLGYYGASVLGTRTRGAVFGAAMAALFAVLYLLLQLEQTALVLGSLLLFVVLATSMISTRRYDWYAVTRQLDERARSPAASS